MIKELQSFFIYHEEDRSNSHIGSSMPTDAQTNFNNSFKKTDVSWSFGTNYLTRSNVGIDARYNLGLTDVSKTTQILRTGLVRLGYFISSVNIVRHEACDIIYME
jgi:hypothetical protein